MFLRNLSNISHYHTVPVPKNKNENRPVVLEAGVEFYRCQFINFRDEYAVGRTGGLTSPLCIREIHFLKDA
jgi:hypothetical protein